MLPASLVINACQTSPQNIRIYYCKRSLQVDAVALVGDVLWISGDGLIWWLGCFIVGRERHCVLAGEQQGIKLASRIVCNLSYSFYYFAAGCEVQRMDGSDLVFEFCFLLRICVYRLFL